MPRSQQLFFDSRWSDDDNPVGEIPLCLSEQSSPLALRNASNRPANLFALDLRKMNEHLGIRSRSNRKKEKLLKWLGHLSSTYRMRRTKGFNEKLLHMQESYRSAVCAALYSGELIESDKSDLVNFVFAEIHTRDSLINFRVGGGRERRQIQLFRTMIIEAAQQQGSDELVSGLDNLMFR